jgi:predicted MFS family arabinose efflux permease
MEDFAAVLRSALLIGLAFGLVAGYFTARASERRETIYGGAASRIMHYITASLFTGLPIAVLLTAILGESWWRAILTALVLLVIVNISAYIFALFERPAREQALTQKAQQGYTEADARTSGL